MDAHTHTHTYTLKVSEFHVKPSPFMLEPDCVLLQFISPKTKNNGHGKKKETI